ncbi:MAG TPA: hypothetical protein PK514_07350 [Spirochaetota bacterium]|nr:hypothetical protein [Spirochaetota bacterium]
MIKKFKTDYTLEECKIILKVNRWKFKYYFLSDKNNFIKSYGTFFYTCIPERNSWNIFYYGLLKRKHNYTLIEGIFFIHPYTIILNIIFIFLLLFLSLIINEKMYIYESILILVIINSIGLIGARKHPSQISNYLKIIFNAKDKN